MVEFRRKRKDAQNMQREEVNISLRGETETRRGARAAEWNGLENRHTP